MAASLPFMGYHAVVLEVIPKTLTPSLPLSFAKGGGEGIWDTPRPPGSGDTAPSALLLLLAFRDE